MGRQIVTYAGFLLALIVFVIAVMVGILFISPDSSIFGVTSVTAKEVYTTYTAKDIPGIRDAFLERNFIIESNYIDVEIRVRKSMQHDEGSIQVWEDSSGLSFNSVKRTRVEWAQVIIPREHIDEVTGKVTIKGEIFYKIKIIEPNGIVSRSDRSFVYLNLFATDDNPTSPFTFVLNTGRSNISFAADDDKVLHDNPLQVKTLEIRNSRGTIYLPPAPENSAAGSFYVDVEDVIVDTASVTLDCESPVSGDVSIKCDSGKFSFRNIGGNIKMEGKSNTISFDDVGNSAVADSGNITVSGIYISLTQKKGKIFGDVDFGANNGDLSVVQCRSLVMKTANANANISALAADVDFEATGSGAIKAARIRGGDEARVKTLSGSVSLDNVWIDTFIESRFGEIQVGFDTEIPIGGSDEPSLTVNSYDGDVTARNICGVVDIKINALGNANVDASFRHVLGPNNQIIYAGSTNPQRNKGEITVTFANDIAYCFLKIERMSSAYNRTNPTMLSVKEYPGTVIPTDSSLVNGTEYHVNYAKREGEQPSSGNLMISTSNKFNLYNRAL